MRIRPVLVAGFAAVLVGSAISVPSSAVADPPDWDDSLLAFQVGVPSSLLVAIGEEVSIAYGATAANTALVASTSSFAPIATGALVPTLAAGTIVAAGAVAFSIGTDVAKAVGVDYEVLCAGSVPGIDQTLAQITRTDCTHFNQDAQLQAQLNFDQAWQLSGAAIGSQSCDSNGTCGEIYALSITEGYAGYCIVTTGPSLNYTQVSVIYDAVPGYWYGGSDYQSPPSARYSNCPDNYSGNQVAWLAGVVNGRPGTQWAVTQLAGYSSGTALPAASRPDPARVIRCTLEFSDNTSASADTAEFHESDGQIPRAECPPAPIGKQVVAVKLYLVTGTTMLAMGSIDVLAGYADWRTSYPACGDGSCALDLLRNGLSCFRETVDCEGWIDDPSRAANYQCKYGAVTLDLEECFIYGPLFNALDRDSGHAYGDPSTGETLTEKTSPTAVDVVTATLLERGWETWEAPLHFLGDVPIVLERGGEVEAAREVAQQCVIQGSAEECSQLPIFSPGSNIAEASDHDRDAMLAGSVSTPQPAVLHWLETSLRYASGWYSTISPCDAPYAGDKNCDEYPYRSTSEGGPGSSLRVIDLVHNQSEGVYLGHFYSACGVGATQREFIVVPVSQVWTSQWCN